MTGKSRKPRIGILKCGHVHDTVTARNGDYNAWFRNLLDDQGFDMPAWAVVDMEFPDSIDAADGWLVTGSPLGAYEDHAFIATLMAFIRDVQAAGKPMVGICFGHQVIARALGGTVEKAAVGLRIGHQTYTVDGIGTLTLNAWHQDQVIVPPQEAEIIATGPDVPVGGMRINDTTLTLQTHPELTNACLLDLIELRRDSGSFAPGQVETAEASATEPTDSDRAADWIGGFFRDRLGA